MNTDTAVPQLPTDYLRDPYPFFAEMRCGPGIFRGTVMDYSKTPESLRPRQEYAAVSFDAVNRVLRDGRVFNSSIYDSTIGLFIGPSLLAMEARPTGITAIWSPLRSSRSRWRAGNLRWSARSSTA